MDACMSPRVGSPQATTRGHKGAVGWHGWGDGSIRRAVRARLSLPPHSTCTSVSRVYTPFASTGESWNLTRGAWTGRKASWSFIELGGAGRAEGEGGASMGRPSGAGSSRTWGRRSRSRTAREGHSLGVESGKERGVQQLSDSKVEFFPKVDNSFDFRIG